MNIPMTDALTECFTISEPPNPEINEPFVGWTRLSKFVQCSVGKDWHSVFEWVFFLSFLVMSRRLLPLHHHDRDLRLFDRPLAQWTPVARVQARLGLRPSGRGQLRHDWGKILGHHLHELHLPVQRREMERANRKAGPGEGVRGGSPNPGGDMLNC